jgi:hypothetical protein
MGSSGPNSSLVNVKYRAAAAAVSGVVLCASITRAQQCDTVSSRTSLSAFSGVPIRSLRVLTQGPPSFPGVARALDHLHVRTREATVRRQLQFSAGDTLDTLAVGESIRRLRSLRYLRDAELVGVRCRTGPVDVVLRTSDDWSVKPKLQMRSGGRSELAITERNLLGSGRELSLHARTQQGRLGVGFTLNDPWFLGSRYSAQLGQDTYRDGQEWTAMLRLREETVLAPWGAELGGVVSAYEPKLAGSDAFERASGHLLLRRRLFETPAAVFSILGGAETERAELAAGTNALIVGPRRADRNFVGASIGAARTSVAYDTLTWLLPNAAIVDVPLSFETEGVMGLGREFVRDVPMVHFDLWSGKAWLPSRQSLAVADVWAAGYASSLGVDAATLRASFAYYRAAKRGFWTTRFTAERLIHPDPDVRSFVTIDPTTPVLPDGRRLAVAGLGFTAERDVRLRPLTRSWALDGAIFGSASSRWETATPGAEHTDVALLGLGLRLSPTRLGRATARLDVGYPISRSPLAKRGLYFGIGLSPWWGDDRHRPSRRD